MVGSFRHQAGGPSQSSQDSRAGGEAACRLRTPAVECGEGRSAYSGMKCCRLKPRHWRLCEICGPDVQNVEMAVHGFAPLQLHGGNGCGLRVQRRVLLVNAPWHTGSKPLRLPIRVMAVTCCIACSCVSGGSYRPIHRTLAIAGWLIKGVRRGNKKGTYPLFLKCQAIQHFGLSVW